MFLGADVEELEDVAAKCQDGAETTDQVIAFLQALVVALMAASFFTGGASAKYAQYLRQVVIPWLQKISAALKLFAQVLGANADAQRRVSAGETVDFGALPTYRTPSLPAGDTTDYPPIVAPGTGGPAPVAPVDTGAGAGTITIPGSTIPGSTIPGSTIPGSTVPGGTIPGGHFGPATSAPAHTAQVDPGPGAGAVLSGAAAGTPAGAGAAGGGTGVPAIGDGSMPGGAVPGGAVPGGSSADGAPGAGGTPTGTPTGASYPGFGQPGGVDGELAPVTATDGGSTPAYAAAGAAGALGLAGAGAAALRGRGDGFTSPGGFDYHRVRGVSDNPNVTPEFLRRVEEVAESVGTEPEHLMAVMSFETGETFSPSVRNPAPGSTATGLIQFLEPTARGLGTTTAELARMSPVEQLDYVERYLAPHRGRIGTVEGLYSSILAGRAVPEAESTLFADGTRAYRANAGLDADGDGRITAGEAAAKVRAKVTD